MRFIRNAFSPAAIIIKRDNFGGGCGGNFSYTIDFNKTSQQFQGHLSFTDYCDQGIIISGQTDVNGTFDAVMFLVQKLEEPDNTKKLYTMIDVLNRE